MKITKKDKKCLRHVLDLFLDNLYREEDTEDVIFAIEYISKKELKQLIKASKVLLKPERYKVVKEFLEAIIDD